MHGTNVDPRELALQIVDIVALRPEVELCYTGIANKCFEILESRRAPSSSTPEDVWDGRPEEGHLSGGLNGGAVPEDGSEAEDEDEEEEEDGDGDGDEEGEAPTPDTESEEEEEEDESDDVESEGEGEDGGRGAARLRLREILFYDDKVAVFKARHGRL